MKILDHSRWRHLTPNRIPGKCRILFSQRLYNLDDEINQSINKEFNQWIQRNTFVDFSSHLIFFVWLLWVFFFLQWWSFDVCVDLSEYNWKIKRFCSLCPKKKRVLTKIRLFHKYCHLLLFLFYSVSQNLLIPLWGRTQWFLIILWRLKYKFQTKKTRFTTNSLWLVCDYCYPSDT